MDSETIADQIVKSLSFEVVAVPQNMTAVDSTSKSTPLNVKIKVRKKHGTALRHGVLSMPAVDTRTERQKNETPARIRLVSSDQTIMNFNVLMEADFDKVAPGQRQTLKMISPDYGINNKDISLTKNADQLQTVHFFPKRNRDIFGTCKPGGCLDPPYGEDRYAYKPTQKMVLSLTKENETRETTKQRSSSIFKNNIFKKKRKSSEDKYIPEISNENKTESKTELDETDSILASAQYSDSLITYPHSSDSDQVYKQEERKLSRDEEKRVRKRYSSGETTRKSSIDNGSYFVVPKKTRNLSNQSDTTNKIDKKTEKIDINIMKLREEITPENNDSLLNLPQLQNRQKSQTTERNFLDAPIINLPLLATLPAVIRKREEDNKDSSYTNLQITNEFKVSETKVITEFGDNTFDHETDKIPPEVFTKNTGFLKNIEYEKNEYSYPTINITQSTEDVLDNEQNVVNDKIDENKNKTSYLDIDSQYKTDLKSQLLVTRQREKSLLDVTTNSTKGSFAKIESKTSQLLEKQIALASEDICKIWETDSAVKSINSEIPKNGGRNFDESNKNTEEIILCESSNKINIKEENELFYNKDSAIDFESSIFDLSNQHNLSNQHDDNNKDTLKLNDDNNEGNTMSQRNDSKKYENMYRSIEEKLLTLDSQIMENEKDIYNTELSNTISSKSEISMDKLYDNFREVHSITDHTDGINDFYKVHSITDHTDEINNFYKVHSITDHTDGINDFYKAHSITDHTDGINDFHKYPKEDKKQFSENYETKNKTDTVDKVGDAFNIKDHIDGVHDLDTFVKNTSDSYLKNNEIKDIPKLFDEFGEVNYNTDHVDRINEINDYSKNAYEPFSNNYEVNHKTETLENNKHYFRENLGGLNKVAFADTTGASFTADDIVTIESLMEHKKEKSVSDISINGSQRLPYSVALHDELENHHDINKYKNDDNMKALQEQNESSGPTVILKRDGMPWKMDIALHSYTNKNNEKVIKSYDTKNMPHQSTNDVLLVTQCYMGIEANEIKIPIDSENDLSIKIASNKSQNLLQQYSCYDIGGNNNDVKVKKKIKINVPVSDSNIEDHRDVNKSDASNSNKDNNMSDDIRNALNKIYEEELVPLRDIIKGLREEIDALVCYHTKFKENILVPVPKRSRVLRFPNSNRRCACVKKVQHY